VNCLICVYCCLTYDAYSDSKYGFPVKKSIKFSYKFLLLSDSTFFKLLNIFAAIIEAQVFVYPPHRMWPAACDVSLY